jgi:Cu-processing system permease protein
VTWFLFALAFDLALLALLVGIDDGLSQQGLTQIMLLNPADIFRLVNLTGLNNSEVSGALAVAINAGYSVTQLLLTLCAWVILPLALAIALFKGKAL